MNERPRPSLPFPSFSSFFNSFIFPSPTPPSISSSFSSFPVASRPPFSSLLLPFFSYSIFSYFASLSSHRYSSSSFLFHLVPPPLFFNLPESSLPDFVLLLLYFFFSLHPSLSSCTLFLVALSSSLNPPFLSPSPFLCHTFFLPSFTSSGALFLFLSFLLFPHLLPTSSSLHISSSAPSRSFPLSSCHFGPNLRSHPHASKS